MSSPDYTGTESVVAEDGVVDYPSRIMVTDEVVTPDGLTGFVGEFDRNGKEESVAKVHIEDGFRWYRTAELKKKSI